MNWPHEIFAGVCDGIEYKILDDHTRNVKYDEVDSPYDFVCDGIESNSIISSDWKGPGWYRMSDPAGSQMSEEPVPRYHCGTQFGGRAFKPVTRDASLYRVSKKKFPTSYCFVEYGTFKGSGSFQMINTQNMTNPTIFPRSKWNMGEMLAFLA